MILDYTIIYSRPSLRALSLRESERERERERERDVFMSLLFTRGEHEVPEACVGESIQS